VDDDADWSYLSEENPRSSPRSLDRKLLEAKLAANRAAKASQVAFFEEQQRAILEHAQEEVAQQFERAKNQRFARQSVEFEAFSRAQQDKLEHDLADLDRRTARQMAMYLTDLERDRRVLVLDQQAKLAGEAASSI